MMTFPEILDAIDTLSDEQLAQVERRIFQKRKKVDMPDLSSGGQWRWSHCKNVVWM